jgi:hypothetical protein
MVKIFGRLNQPMVTETGYAIPSFTSNGLIILFACIYL